VKYQLSKKKKKREIRELWMDGIGTVKFMWMFMPLIVSMLFVVLATSPSIPSNPPAHSVSPVPSNSLSLSPLSHSSLLVDRKLPKMPTIYFHPRLLHIKHGFLECENLCKTGYPIHTYIHT
jgi:hypothetical protein